MVSEYTLFVFFFFSISLPRRRVTIENTYQANLVSCLTFFGLGFCNYHSHGVFVVVRHGAITQSYVA